MTKVNKLMWAFIALVLTKVYRVVAENHDEFVQYLGHLVGNAELYRAGLEPEPFRRVKRIDHNYVDADVVKENSTRVRVEEAEEERSNREERLDAYCKRAEERMQAMDDMQKFMDIFERFDETDKTMVGEFTIVEQWDHTVC